MATGGEGGGRGGGGRGGGGRGLIGNNGYFTHSM